MYLWGEVHRSGGSGYPPQHRCHQSIGVIKHCHHLNWHLQLACIDLICTDTHLQDEGILFAVGQIQF